MSDERVVFLHCVNIADYDGYEPNIHAGGFKFARENGFGGEMYNFRNVNGRCFGHVEVMPRKIKGILTPVSLDLGHLAAPKDASHIDGVLVIWTAPCRGGKGSEVVGWYRNAILYRDRQYPKGQFKRQRSFKDPKSGKMYYLPRHGASICSRFRDGRASLVE